MSKYLKVIFIFMIILLQDSCSKYNPYFDKPTAQVRIFHTDEGFWIEYLDDFQPGLGRAEFWLFLPGDQPRSIGIIEEGKKRFFKCMIRRI